MSFTKQYYRISMKGIGQKNGKILESYTCEMNPENYKFWLDCIGARLEDIPITEDRVDYIRDINNKLFPLK